MIHIQIHFYIIASHAVVDDVAVAAYIAYPIPPIIPRGNEIKKAIMAKIMMNGATMIAYKTPVTAFQIIISGSCRMKNGNNIIFRNERGHIM